MTAVPDEDGARLVLFDLDGTLLGGASSERRFAAWLFLHGHARGAQAGAWIAHAAARVGHDGRNVLRRNKAYLTGLRVSRVAGLAEEHVEGVVRSGAIDAGVRREVDRHRRAGDRTVLLSGTLQPLAAAYARRLGLDAAVASLVPERAGRYVSGAPSRHPYADVKRTLAERLAADAGIDRARTVAYADSMSDRALLEWVGEPVSVEPGSALGALARRRGWRVLRHGQGRPETASSDVARVGPA